jgi:hypothetical protein
MSIVNTAMTAVLAALAGVAPQVGRVRLRPLSATATTAVVVRPLHSEVLESQMTAGYPVSWNTAFAVECYARTTAQAAPDAAVDALVADVFSRLMADTSLGGAVVVLQPQGVAYDFDVDGEQTVCATFQFIARQRTVGPIF